MPTTINGTTGVSKVQDDVIEQADLKAGVAGTGPAFSAYKSADQSLANVTSTKILFETEEFDTASYFASSRFTPTIAGYYLFTSAIAWGGGTGTANMYFMKNGVRFKDGNSDALDTVANTTNASSLIYLNGSTDYVEVYASQNSGASLPAVAGVNLTYFQGCLIRSAT
jgi:hypothetical protein